MRCAYEKTPVGPAMIVPWSSATRFCEGAPPAIEASHITIVKPDRPGADAILVLVSALNDYVLNKSLEAKLETPDFTQEGDAAVFVLHDVAGQAERTSREQRRRPPDVHAGGNLRCHETISLAG